MPLDDRNLANGLKIMFTQVAMELSLAAPGPTEDFVRAENQMVDGFINALERNGYKIVKIADE